MSLPAPNVSWLGLRAAQAIVRGQSADPADLSQLLDVDSDTAERLLRPGVHTPAMKLAVLLCLIRRLRGSEATQHEIHEALRVHWRLEQAKATIPADDLTMDEMRAAQALLRGGAADIEAASEFLGCSTFAARRLLLIAGDSHALDDLLIATLLVRLHGRRTSMRDLLKALSAVVAREMRDLRLALMH